MKKPRFTTTGVSHAAQCAFRTAAIGVGLFATGALLHAEESDSCDPDPPADPPAERAPGEIVHPVPAPDAPPQNPTPQS